MIKSLCDEYGKKIGTLNGIDYHQFPSLGKQFFLLLRISFVVIDELDKSDLEQRLRELNFGYRARYIQEAIQFIKYTAGGMIFFEQLKTLSVKEARMKLLKIMGIGRKVIYI
jgi:N-glycosylase/DNA lyase